MSVKFNDEHIPDSPFRVPVVPSTGAARLVTVQALKQKGLEVNTYYQYCDCVFLASVDVVAKRGKLSEC